MYLNALKEYVAPIVTRTALVIKGFKMYNKVCSLKE